jgi:hypothetical protein
MTTTTRTTQCTNRLHQLCPSSTSCSCACHTPDQPMLFPEATPAAMNAVGSPTGRVMRDSPDTSTAAAHRAGAPTLRELVHTELQSDPWGCTSIELARRIPQLVVSNRANSRLGELWEEGRAAVLREHGRCELGVCRVHVKPGAVHRPQAPCELHGKPTTREGAAVWVAVP